MPDAALVWFRRDLRNEDHTALHEALNRYSRVYCAFVFDTDILDQLPSREDRRVEFIWEACRALDAALRQQGGALIVRHGPARDLIPRLAVTLGVAAVFANHDYEPSGAARDDAVRGALGSTGIAWHSFKDQVVFEKDEVLSGGGTPYSVFTPYRKAWLKRLTAADLAPRPVHPRPGQLAGAAEAGEYPALDTLGFVRTDLASLALPAGMQGAQCLWADFRPRMAAYRVARDFPARKGVSYLSPHLRFGTVSVRALARHAWSQGDAGSGAWLDELIWRDFYHQILWHRPDVVTRCFKPEFERVAWAEGAAAERAFAAWCEGRTGYPLVDAAMRQLIQSGWMHNRLRMVTASFLTKDLGIDWRRGEQHFARWLNDYDLAANNGGWQWAASTGCDAQPWFRIFNPVSQSQKFDPEGRFIRRYCPELSGVPARHIHAPWLMSPVDQQAAGCVVGRDWPAPVVDHAEARARTLARFGAVRGAPGPQPAPDA